MSKYIVKIILVSLATFFICSLLIFVVGSRVQYNKALKDESYLFKYKCYYDTLAGDNNYCDSSEMFLNSETKGEYTYYEYNGSSVTLRDNKLFEIINYDLGYKKTYDEGRLIKMELVNFSKKILTYFVIDVNYNDIYEYNNLQEAKLSSDKFVKINDEIIYIH